MDKSVSKKVFYSLLAVLLMANFITLFFYTKAKIKLSEAEKAVNEYHRMIENLESLSFYRALEKDLGFSEDAAFRLTDGKNRYIFIQKIYLTDILDFYDYFPEIKDKKIKKLCQAGFFHTLNQSERFIYVSEEEIKAIKEKYAACLIPYDRYEKTEKILNKLSLKRILKMYFIEIEDKYLLTPNLKKFKDFSPNLMFAYLYFNYNILVSCPESRCFIDKKLNPQLKRLVVY